MDLQQNEDDEEIDIDQDDEDLLSHMQNVNILDNFLLFIQSCMEGHYMSMQNYFRYQFKSRTNYDIVIEVADLFRAYYFDARTQSTYDSMVQCVNTLSEFVQGPCPDNQIAVSESKFFDVCQDLFTIIQKKDTISGTTTMKSMRTVSTKKSTSKALSQSSKLTKSKTAGSVREDSALVPWMKSRLQNKCLILILSLLEMRDVSKNCSIIKKLIRYIPVTMIELQIYKNYKNYEKIYGEQYIIQALEHLSKDPREYSEAEQI